jgi:DNA-3-methyladenine glycosylase I
MADFESYCAYCATLAPEHPDRYYHDHEYGFPIEDEATLFGRFIMEINQAGLSWSTILKKRAGFEAAYAGFDIDAIAAFGDEDVARLLAYPGIIRNRLKIRAAIDNAKAIRGLRGDYGSFKGWLDAHHPLPKDEWLRLFKRHFRFVGGEIVGELLMSAGYLPGSHVEGCPAGRRAIQAGAPWARVDAGA